MSNQVILWSMLVLPVLTLLFMPKEDIKRWAPAALFTMVTGILTLDIGVAMEMWTVSDNLFFLNETLPFGYTVLPIATMWILKYTYGRFWLFFIAELVLSIGFAYQILPWLSGRGIWVIVNVTPFLAFIPTIPHFITIYLYQKWQDGIFAHLGRMSFSFTPQPAAAKLLDNNIEDTTDNDDK